jgi:PAS domain S-box-containing protein
MDEIKHDLFFELTVDMLCVANLDGYFVDVNGNFCETLGYTKEELLSRPYQSFVHPDDIDKTEVQSSKSRSGLDIMNFVNRYLCADGSYVSLSWSARSEENNGLIYAIARNVTDEVDSRLYHKQIDKALNDATIYVETDKEGFITKVNSEFCKISGYSEQELIGQTHKIVNSGLHSDDVFKRLWQTISEGKVWTGTLKNRRKDGTHYYVKTLIAPILNASDEIQKYVAIRQDITESIETSSALTKANKILNETSAIAKVGGWELTVSTGELNWTDETFSILEVEKKNDSKPMLPEGLALFTESSAPIIDHAVSRAIEFGEPYSLELEALTAKGNVKWVYTNGRANFKDGQVTTLSGTIQDIDARKKAELAYQSEKQKSIHSAKLASLGELAASMAHEVNNPLGIISGNAELLLEIDDLPEVSQDRVNIILKSTERISHIVKGLKKFTGNRTSFSTVRDLSEVVSEALTLAKPRLKTERVASDVNLADSLFVLCNEIEIEQVILNLINNAIDATQDQETRKIRLETKKEGDNCCLYLWDTGSGIEPDVASKIFEPFYSTKGKTTNSGLGLSISKEIVLEHGGDLELLLDENQTCFKISFPFSVEKI